MIVSITVTTELSAGGGGDGESVLGIIPAKAVPERAHASATAITNRFILFSPFWFGGCKTSDYKTRILHMLNFLHGAATIANIRP